MIAKILFSVMLIAILRAIVYLNINKSYAAPYVSLSVSLTEVEYQFLPNQLALHMDNQTNGGAAKVITNETVQYITKYNATCPAFTAYSAYKNAPITIGNTTYNGIFMFVSIPYDREKYLGLLIIESFHYPNTVLLLLGYTKVYFHLPYRQAEGIAQGHAKGNVPSIPDYSTISRRINKWKEWKLPGENPNVICCLCGSKKYSVVD